MLAAGAGAAGVGLGAGRGLVMRWMITMPKSSATRMATATSKTTSHESSEGEVTAGLDDCPTTALPSLMVFVTVQFEQLVTMVAPLFLRT